MNLFRAIFGGVREISSDQYRQQFNDTPHILIDIRNTQEYASGHIQGSQNIPLNKLAKKLNKLPKQQPIVVVCRNGARGREAVDMLQNAGFKASNLVGGVMNWRKDGGILSSSN